MAISLVKTAFRELFKRIETILIKMPHKHATENRGGGCYPHFIYSMYWWGKETKQDQPPIKTTQPATIQDHFVPFLVAEKIILFHF